MTRLAGVVAALSGALALTPAAVAAAPRVSVSASPAAGAAPLTVTLTAAGDPASYTWDLGDGSSAAGATVTHTYTAAGRYRAVVTARAPGGESASAEVEVVARTVAVAAPAAPRYRARVSVTGRVEPAEGGLPVTLLAAGRRAGATRTRPDGTFRLRVRALRGGAWSATVAGVAAAPVRVRLRPLVRVRVSGSAVVGGLVVVGVTVLPRAAGAATLTVRLGGRELRRERAGRRTGFRASRRGRYVFRAGTPGSGSFAPASAAAAAEIGLPELGPGSAGPPVLQLEQRLAELRYALIRVDAVWGSDTTDAVYAFQKVHGLARTGRVGATFWAKLVTAAVPRPRFGLHDHVEVSKGRQFLLLVRGGRVDAVVQVSTGATGNTPLGRWRVYRKVAGWDWVLWYPSYFLRGFAVHGYPSVPPYPASHGCVRVPMWAATRLYSALGYGAEVDIYW